MHRHVPQTRRVPEKQQLFRDRNKTNLAPVALIY